MRLNRVAGLAVDGAVSVQAWVVDMGGNLYWQEEGSKNGGLKRKEKQLFIKLEDFCFYHKNPLLINHSFYTEIVEDRGRFVTVLQQQQRLKSADLLLFQRWLRRFRLRRTEQTELR